MQHRMLQLIAFLLNKFDKKLFSENLIVTLSNDLQSEGFTQNEIDFAINWIEDSISDSTTEKQQTFRVLNQIEAHILEPDTYGYLLKLFKNKLLTTDEMESVIEYACNLGVGHIDVNDVNEIISVLEMSFEAKAKKQFINYIANSSGDIN